MELAPGESRTLHFRYALPSGILGDNHYELLVQKQAGTQNIPLQITLSSKERTPTLQNGAGTISSSAGSIRVDTDLLVDRHLSVRLQ